MKNKILSVVALSLVLLFSGCATDQSVAPAVKKELHQPTPKVAGLIKKYNLEVVDYAYTKKEVANGTRKGAKALMIDARPAKMYLKSTIPSSLNIPDTKFDEYVKQLNQTPKDREILVFCGGWHCGKSPKVAGALKKKGFTDVKLYQAGEPEWKKRSYVEVGTPVVVAVQKKNSAFIIDARPYKKYLGGAVAGAVSMPDMQIDKFVGRFPADKATKIITYCGGYNCAKSHVVARKLISLGYSDVSVYAGGMPAWKKAGLGASNSKADKPANLEASKAGMMVAGIKLGLDEGTVDGEWFKANLGRLPDVQIVDVRTAEEFKDGALPGAINIYAEKLKAKEFYAKLPKDKTIVLNCSAGAWSLEAWMKLDDAKLDISRVFYFDANLDCADGKCKVEVNEPLG